MLEDGSIFPEYSIIGNWKGYRTEVLTAYD